MKSIFTLGIIFMMIVSGLTQISEKKVAGSFGTQNAFVVEHVDATAEHAEDAWKELMKEFSKKTKYNRKSYTWETNEAKMPTISSKDLNLYMMVTEGNGMTITSVFFDDGMMFLGSDNSEDAIVDINGLLGKYHQLTQKLVIEDELELEENNLKSLEKSLEKLKKENQKLHEQIADYEQKIVEAEDNIITNIDNQQMSEEAINDQKGLIEMIKEKLNVVLAK